MNKVYCYCYACFEYISPWSRQTKLTNARVRIACWRACIHVRYILWVPVHEQTLVIFLLFVHIILIKKKKKKKKPVFVSGKINFTALICKEFNLFLENIATSVPHNWCIINMRFNWTFKNSFLVSMSTMYLSFDRRKSRFDTVLYTLSVCESQRSLLSLAMA